MERVLEADFDIAAVRADLSAPEDGALVFFFGSVRDNAEGRKVERLRYEVYRDMAEAAIRRIEEEVRETKRAHRVFVQHRVGDLVPEDSTILVVATAPHRNEAFDACREALERVKAEVPVWKKEIYEDGGEAWVEGHPEGSPPSEE